MTRSVAKKRSATNPTKNGETSDATAVVPKTAPAAVAEKWSVLVRYVVIVTYQAPQMMYWRNIITPRRVLRNVFMDGSTGDGDYTAITAIQRNGSGGTLKDTRSSRAQLRSR